MVYHFDTAYRWAQMRDTRRIDTLRQAKEKGMIRGTMCARMRAVIVTMAAAILGCVVGPAAGAIQTGDAGPAAARGRESE